MKKELIRSLLEAFAVGDAYGKATEYCSLEQVQAHYSRIDELLPPEKAIAHQDLFYGQVTDDTEQNVYLLREYARQGRVTPYDTAMCLLRWVQETDAATKYIGPNSLKALRAIEQGADVTTAGTGGTTCGGMMRAPVAFLFSTPDTLTQNVVTCLMPTHNTSVAIEAAMCYAYALQAAEAGKPMEQILDNACEGAQIGKGFGSTHRVALLRGPTAFSAKGDPHAAKRAAGERISLWGHRRDAGLGGCLRLQLRSVFVRSKRHGAGHSAGDGNGRGFRHHRLPGGGIVHPVCRRAQSAPFHDRSGGKSQSSGFCRAGGYCCDRPQINERSR